MITALIPKSDFPALGDAVYLNQASIGLVSRCSAEAQEAWDARLRNGTINFNDADEEQALDLTRAQIAELLRAGSHNIAILSSATEGLLQFAHWCQPTAGENVVCIGSDFPSVILPWRKRADNSGLELRELTVERQTDSVSADALSPLVDANTSAICVSHVHYATGHMLDLEGIGEIAKRHGARLMVDMTQSAGVVPIDLSRIKVDMAVGTSHKWLCAPHGAAWCYLGPNLLETFDPPLVGWRSLANSTAFDRKMQLHSDARRLELGCVSYSAGIALGHATRYLLEIGIDRIAAYVRALTAELGARIESLGGHCLTPDNDDSRAAILTAAFPTVDARVLVSMLEREGIYVSARGGAVRFSVHLFNDVDDIRRTIEVLSKLLRKPS